VTAADNPEAVAHAIASLHREALAGSAPSLLGMDAEAALRDALHPTYGHGDILRTAGIVEVASRTLGPIVAARVEAARSAEQRQVRATMAKEVHALAQWLARERDDLPGAAAASALANAWEGRR
jgi:hypothetical protein